MKTILLILALSLPVLFGQHMANDLVYRFEITHYCHYYNCGICGIQLYRYIQQSNGHSYGGNYIVDDGNHYEPCTGQGGIEIKPTYNIWVCNSCKVLLTPIINQIQAYWETNLKGLINQHAQAREDNEEQRLDLKIKAKRDQLEQLKKEIKALKKP